MLQTGFKYNTYNLLLIDDETYNKVFNEEYLLNRLIASNDKNICV